MKMKQIKLFIILSLVLTALISCSNDSISQGMFVDSYVELKDIPSSTDIVNKENIPSLEKEVEDAFGNILWKAPINLTNMPSSSLYIKITDSAKNLLEFNTSSSLKTFSYKVIEGKWLVLQNKSKNVTIKFIKKDGNKIGINIPLNIINPSSSSSKGIELVLEESNDNIITEDSKNPNDNENPGEGTEGETDKPGTDTEGETEKPGTNPGDKPGINPDGKPGTDTEGDNNTPGTNPEGNPGEGTEGDNNTPGTDSEVNPGEGTEGDNNKPGTDTEGETGGNPETNPDVKPNPDEKPTPEIKPTPTIPEEKNFTSSTFEEMYTLITEANFNNVYFDISDYWKDYEGNFSSLKYKQGIVSITENTFAITGSEGYSPTIKYNVEKVEKKTQGTDDVFIASLNVVESSDEKIPNGLYFLIFEKRGEGSSLTLTNFGLKPIFNTTNEYDVEAIKQIKYSNDVFEKLLAITLQKEENYMGLEKPGEVAMTKINKTIIVDNKVYSENTHLADYKIINAFFGVGTRRGGYPAIGFEIEFTNSTNSLIGNTTYTFILYTENCYKNGHADGYPTLHWSPLDVPVMLKIVPNEKFINVLDTQLDVDREIFEREIKKEGIYHLTKESDIYKIVNQSGELYASFKILQSALMGDDIQNGGGVPMASIEIIERNNTILDKQYFLILVDGSDIMISDYDEDYRFSFRSIKKEEQKP